MKSIINKPIIIIGAGRSGTTLLAETILSRHPDIAYLSEPTPIWSSGNAYRTHDILTVNDATPRISRNIISRFERFIFASSKQRFMEKTPRNCLRIPFINKIFPDAKFVHVIRDGREVSLSASNEWKGKPGNALDGQELRKLSKLPRLFKTSLRGVKKVLAGASFFEIPVYVYRYIDLFRRQIFNSDTVLWGVLIPGLKQIRSAHSLMETCAIQWEYCTIRARSAGMLMSKEKYLEVRYEDLIANPRPVVSNICDFLELPINEEILSDLVKEVHESSTIEKWRTNLTAQEIFKIEQLTGSTLLSLGYSLTEHTAN